MTTQTTTAAAPAAAPQKAQQNNQVAIQDNISDQVLSKIERLQAAGDLVLPANYSAGNHLKLAWLAIQAAKDRNEQPALQVCTKGSIANALLDMVLQGLSVGKHQGYFVVHGKELTFMRSYFGTVAAAKRAAGMPTDPVANVIYEGDNFEYEINPNTGITHVLKHEQKFENINNAKIRGAYAIVVKADGTTQTTIMNMDQIRAAWNMGASKGGSPAHKNFSEEMAKKTVIHRACKMLINSSDDAWLYEGTNDGMEVDTATADREAAIKEEKKVIAEDVDFEEVGQAAAPKEEAPATAAEVDTEAAPY